jgi:predicted permease
MWWTTVLDHLRQDLIFGLRGMLRGPLTSGAAVLSLALGIGATTAMLGAIDVWLVRPLPLPDGENLVRVYMSNPERGWSTNAFSGRDFVDWRDASRSVEVAAYRRSGSSLAVDEQVERVSVLIASVNLLRVLGVQPALGRGFTAEEEQDGGPRTVMLADAFWRDAFGADPDVAGRTVSLDGVPHTVVGVLPEAASFAEFRGDVWVPLRVAVDEDRSGHSLWSVGRPAPGVTIAQARADLNVVAARVAEQDPERTFPGATVGWLRDSLYGPEFFQGALVVGAAVLFLLLIACANIANLLLARGARRSGELALRAVLGAGRARIVRQLVTESALLALVGGVLGVGFAYLGVEALRRWILPAALSADARFALDARFLVIAGLATVISTALFGLFPALAGARIDLRGRLQNGTGAGHGPGLRRVGRVLVTGEVALALVLLVFTGLLTRSLVVMGDADLGMRTEGLLSFVVSAPPAGYPSDEEVLDFHLRLAEGVQAIPGVNALAASTHTPVGGYSTSLYSVTEQDAAPGEARSSTQVRWTTSNYAEVMGLRMAAGTWFDPDADTPDGPRVAVASRALVDRHWESPDAALGAQIVLGEQAWTVVGVAENVRVLGPANAVQPTLFRPVAQSGSQQRAYVAAVPAGVEPVVNAIRRELRALDPSLALYAVSTVAVQVRSSMGPQVAMRRILLTVGGIAIVLTLVGVYGVTAHMVGLRTRELGVRMAVGARPAEVVTLVLRHAGRVAGWGLVVGIALSLLGGRALAFALVGVSPSDPAVLALVTLGVGTAAVAAALEPALRAARVDPVRALRAD